MKETFQAAGSILGGNARSSAYKTEAALAARQARDVELQSLQTSERRREELGANLAAIEARRAAANLDPDSPTAIAIQSELRRQSVRDEGAERLGFINQEIALRTQAAARRKAAKYAKWGGYIDAAGSLASGAQSAATAGGT